MLGGVPRRAPLAHDGPYYRLNLLPPVARPRRHDHEDLRIDIAAVDHAMVRAAGEVADGIHVHPLHSAHYLHRRLLPALEEGAGRGRSTVADVDLLIPVVVAPGDTPEERAPLVERARGQIAFYGSTATTRSSSTTSGFDGHVGPPQRAVQGRRPRRHVGRDHRRDARALRHRLPVGRARRAACMARYAGIATRLIVYTAAESIRRDPSSLPRWSEVAQELKNRF